MTGAMLAGLIAATAPLPSGVPPSHEPPVRGQEPQWRRVTRFVDDLLTGLKGNHDRFFCGGSVFVLI